MRLRIAKYLCMRGSQQRAQLNRAPALAPLPFRHRRQAFRPGTAQQLQQQRFGLVVLMVRGQQEIRVDAGEGVLSFAPRRGFDAGRVFAIDLNMTYAQGYRMGGAQLRAESGPVVCVGRQAVMHVLGLQFEGKWVAQRHQRMQKHGRIESARKRQRQSRVRRDVAGKAARHRIDNCLIWQEFP
jgi:hypothetical protein